MDAASEYGPAVGLLLERMLHLWILSLAFFFVGDATTTYVGLRSPLIVEVGPIVAPLVRQHDIAAVLGLKAAALFGFYGLYLLVPRPHRVGVPLGLAALGVLTTGWNLTVLLQAA